MNDLNPRFALRELVLFLCLSGFCFASMASSTDIANVPMAVANSVTPNILIVYDNSESMDGYMSGTLVAGNDPSTRGNIGRTSMRNVINNFQTGFNWGLMTYGMNNDPPALQSTYVYYLGDAAGMVFTNNCTGYVPGVFNGAPAISGTSTDGGRHCIANPQPSNGYNYLTFNYSSDDYNINDVLYWTYASTPPLGNQAWAPAANTSNPTTYSWYGNHDSSVNWGASNFSSSIFSSSLTPTDAGFIPGNFGASLPNDISRSLYVARGWGYYSTITGSGTLKESVQTYSTTHQNNLLTLLANESKDTTTEIKNGAVYTPIKGTLASALSYFRGNTTPIKYSCQQNFVMLVTDGLPTGDTNGNLYSSTALTNTCAWSTTSNTCTSGTLGTAATDAVSAAANLRTVSVSGVSSTKPDGSGSITGKFDIQTYVVALGSTVANPLAYSVMNAMANAGGTQQSLAVTDQGSFDDAMGQIADDITTKVGSSAAVTVANAHVTSSDDSSYATTFNSGTWTGDIQSYKLDLTTGAPTGGNLWADTAANLLDNLTSSTRMIVSSVDTAGSTGGVQFQPATASTTTHLSTAQQTLLNTSGQTDGAAVVAYLRGDTTGDLSGTYRLRTHLLGDLINAEPVLVREPSSSYVDAGYAAYVTANSTRTRMLYQGSNDGMLHAFQASTGQEQWAYVPNLILGTLNKRTSKASFTHQYYVDGTPVSGDLDFNKVNGASGTGTDWRTILVGGLGKGGRGYYALDVTSPTASTEAALTSKVLWEFPNSITSSTLRSTAIQNMGYSYTRPIIAKTAAAGWVAIVASGYNNGTNTGDSNGDGLGHLYVINPKTGDLIADISTPACSTTPTSSPCGLAQISGWVVGSRDNTIQYVYGGDMYGNLWRFNFTGTTIASWSVAKFAVLKDASGSTQPVTTAPELALINGNRMLFVGTGEYLGNSDIPGSTGANSASSQTQTMYGLVDSGTTLANPLRPTLQQQTLTLSGTNVTSANHTVNYTSQVGWYADMPSTGERINTDPVIAQGELVFTTNIPSSTICVPGGSSYEYFLKLSTGGLVDNSSVTWSGSFLANALASRPVPIQLPSGKVIILTRTSDNVTHANPLPGGGGATVPKRISWREIFN